MSQQPKHHNYTWFKNRIGQRVYCDDHPEKDWTECKGIEVESEIVVENLLAQQAQGIRFFQ